MSNWMARNAAAAFFAVGIVAPTAWMLLDRDPPFTLLSGEMQPPNPSVGGTVSVVWQAKVKKQCPPTKQDALREVVDAKGSVHTLRPIVRSVDTKPVIVRELSLPDAIAAGPATYQSTTCYACNPVQYFWPICVVSPKVHFDVMALK